MLTTSVTTLLAGIGLIAAAPSVPAQLPALERAGGLLLCVGLMAIGAGLVQMGG